MTPTRQCFIVIPEYAHAFTQRLLIDAGLLITTVAYNSDQVTIGVYGNDTIGVYGNDTIDDLIRIKVAAYVLGYTQATNRTQATQENAR